MIFMLAHPKSIEPDELDALLAKVRGLVQSDCTVVSVVAGRDVFLEWEKNHPPPTDWLAWQNFLIGTTTAFGTVRRFDGFIVAPTCMIGRPTGELLTKALKRGYQILRLTPDDAIVPATKVVALDPNNWTSGWIVA